MYLLFRDKNWKPSDYYYLSVGEKVVVKAFLLQEQEEFLKEQERLRGGANT